MLPLWEDVETGVPGVRVVRLTEPAEIEELVRLIEVVAREERWQPGDAVRRPRDRSVYFAVEAAGQLVGGLQLVLPGPGGRLPCHDLWPDAAPSSLRRGAPTAHVSVLALAPAVRGQSLLFWHLVVEMWRYCVGEGIATLYLEVTPRVLPLYRRLGWPLALQGDKKVHWGEECCLCTLGIADVAQALLVRAEHSRYYRQIIAQAFRVTLPADRPQSDRSRRVSAHREATAGYAL
jgi:hypothetical protein